MGLKQAGVGENGHYDRLETRCYEFSVATDLTNMLRLDDGISNYLNLLALDPFPDNLYLSPG